jgi:tetratricopeptide (TPR) repeat protein
MADDNILQEAINAIQDGDLPRARDLLTRSLKNNQANPEYWLWMSAVVATPKERIYCLQEVLHYDPQNASAKRGLDLLGANPEGDLPKAQTLARRNWQVRQAVKAAEVRALPKLPIRKLIAWGAGGLAVVVLLIVGSLGLHNSNQPAMVVKLSPPGTAVPSATYLPTNTPAFRTPSPTFIGPTPLWMLLPATYTPTPLYGGTPHPRSEAYSTGLRRFEKGDWAGVITFMQQVVTDDPQAVDPYYYMGEAYRFQGDYKDALEQYNQAIQVDASYAPAYLGRARANLGLDAKNNVDDDLQKAVSLDPKLGEAYLEQANQGLKKGDTQAAQAALALAQPILPASPLVYFYAAKVDLALGDAPQALSDAQKANELDKTLLDAYLLLGQALQANGKMAESVDPLKMYVNFEPQSAPALVMLGQAYLAAGDQTDALTILNQAIDADSSQILTRIARGQIYYRQGDYQKALNDFENAMKIDAKSFDANMGRGEALLQLKSKGDAYLQFERAHNLASDPAQLALATYWRAQALEAIDKPDTAAKDWIALLTMTPTYVPSDWATQAQQFLDGWYTATPTPKGTPALTTTVAAAGSAQPSTTGQKSTPTP